MDYDSLPGGPWTQVFSGHWAGHSVSLQENADRLLLLIVFDETAGKTKGAVSVLSKPFLLNAPEQKPPAASSCTLTKTVNNRTLYFALVQSKPAYSGIEPENLASTIREQYAELSHARLAAGRPLSEASEEEREALLGDPLSLFAIASPSAAQRKSRLPVGTSSLGKQVFEDDYRVLAIEGSDDAERSVYLRLLVEQALLSGSDCLVLDECGLQQLSLPKPLDKAKVEAAGLQGAEPVRKTFVLGKDLFIDLPSLDASLFAEEAGFSGDVKVLVVSSQLPANLGDLCRRFEEREEQFVARKACRQLRVLEKKYAGLLGGNKGSDFSSFGASAGASRLHYADLSAAESNLAAYALLNALQQTKASPLIAYAHRGTRVSGQLASLLSSLAAKGYKLALSFDSAINPAFLGEGVDRIDCLLPGQAVLSQGNKNKTRFTPRPPF